MQTHSCSTTMQNHELAERSWSQFTSHPSRSRFNLFSPSAGKRKVTPKSLLSPYLFRMKWMHQSDLQQLLRNNLHLQKEDKAIGRSAQVLSSPLTPDRYKSEACQAQSETAALWDWSGTVEGDVCSSPQFCLPLWAPQYHDGPKWPLQHKQNGN